MPKLNTPNSVRPLRVRATACWIALALALGPWPAATPQVFGPATAPQIILPDLGDADAEVLSPAIERKLGQRSIAEMRRAGELFDDPEINEYLGTLGGELAAASSVAAIDAGVAPADFSFYSIHDSTLNAFALPGGFICVHTGLIASTQTESELASVIGHEIGHVTQRHIARMFGQQKTSSVAMLGALVLALLAARSNSSSSGDIAQAAVMFGQAGAIQSQLNFSRDAEREADRVGFQTLVRAGFEPQGMVDFFTRLQSASRQYESSAPAYLRTHPLTVERITDIQNRVRNEHYRQHVDRFDFLLVRARVQALADTSIAGLGEARSAFLIKTAHAPAGHNPQVAAEFYGLAVTQTMLRDYPAAARSVAQVREHGEPSVLIEKIAADIAIGQNQSHVAINTLAQARKRWPNSGLLRTAYGQALQAAGDHAAAIAYLREQTALYRGDPVLFELLGRSHAALGQPAREHQALAEMYRLRGNLGAAVDQLDMAQRLMRASTSPDDFMLASEVASRLRELRAQLKEEMTNGRNRSEGG